MMKFPQYIHSKERTIEVVGMIDKSPEKPSHGVWIDQKGYLDENGSIWIYSGSGKPKNANEYPYFWINDNDEKEFSDPIPSVIDDFKEDKMRDINIELIAMNTKEGEELYSEQAINDMNASAAIFVPPLNDKDDFLKKIIKNAIIEKKIDISRLKYKMNEKYGLPNMKSALINSTKMSVVYFITWCEILGLDFTIVVEDNGTDPQDPLTEPLFYMSRKDSVVKGNHF